MNRREMLLGVAAVTIGAAVPKLPASAVSYPRTIPGAGIATVRIHGEPSGSVFTVQVSDDGENWRPASAATPVEQEAALTKPFAPEFRYRIVIDRANANPDWLNDVELNLA